jgi:hypothetical protein
VTQVRLAQWSKKNWKCSKPRAGASLHTVLVTGATLQAAVTLVAKWKESYVASGRTLKQTPAVMMVGLKTPQKFVAVWLMPHVLQEGHLALSVAHFRSVGRMVWRAQRSLRINSSL